MTSHLDRQHRQILAALFGWAYSNGIEVRFYTRHEYTDKWPVLRFTRNDKHCEYAFWPLTDIKGRAEALWKNVGFELCVEPLDLRGIE